MQKDKDTVANNWLRIREDDSDAKLPDWKMKTFTDKNELFDWIASDDYTYPGGNEGICYGFQLEEDDDGDYTLTLYFNDQSSGGAQSMGIPATEVPAYNPLQTVPSTDGFTDYLNRGYSVLHNLAANVVLKLETNEASAKITMLTAPLPANND